MLTTLLTALNTKISVQKAANAYSYNGFTNEVSFLPTATLEGNKPGKVWVVGMAPVIHDAVSRSQVYQKDYCVSIAVQRTIDVTDAVLVALMVDLTEELEETARKLLLPGYQWLRNEYLKDPNGTPYSFIGMRDQSQYESYFNAHYRVTIN